jgi:hypothetical protein
MGKDNRKVLRVGRARQGRANAVANAGEWRVAGERCSETERRRIEDGSGSTRDPAGIGDSVPGASWEAGLGEIRLSRTFAAGTWREAGRGLTIRPRRQAGMRRLPMLLAQSTQVIPMPAVGARGDCPIEPVHG